MSGVDDPPPRVLRITFRAADQDALVRAFQVVRQRRVRILGATVSPPDAAGWQDVTLSLSSTTLTGNMAGKLLNRVVSVTQVAVREDEARITAYVAVRATPLLLTQVLAAGSDRVRVLSSRGEEIVLEIGGSEEYVAGFIAGIDGSTIRASSRSGPVFPPWPARRRGAGDR
ncbi:hypothetical protein ACTU3I_05640 [Microbacterium sp. RD1]|uniref:hypothetical protein n=1 Tax=Microbacterium sp. RD1 TaxID=3457313 RepID=UPI003FA58290